jgi:hypothetical protein
MSERKMNHFRDTEMKEDMAEESVSYHRQMYLLYKDGVPDVYDSRDNKINGVPPNPELTIHHLKEMIRFGGVDGYYLLGRLYHHGIHSLKPNLETAKKYYTSVIDHRYPGVDDAIREMTSIYSVESSDYKTKIMDWLNISERPGVAAKPCDKITYHSTPALTVTPKSTPTSTSGERSGKVYREMKSDSQNVHDHTLVNSVNNTVKRLKDTTEMTVSMEDTMRLLRARVSSQPDSDKKKDAIKALDAIERNHMSLVAYNMKETELLHLLWNRIVNNHSDNPDLKDNLYNQLSDSVEHDSVVCSSGRFTRLLDSLNVVDPDVVIKSKEVIHRELMDKSSLIQTRMYNECSPEDQEELDSQEISRFSAMFSERLRNTIRAEFKSDYVDSGIMTQSDLDSELSVWIQYV